MKDDQRELGQKKSIESRRTNDDDVQLVVLHLRREERKKRNSYALVNGEEKCSPDPVFTDLFHCRHPFQELKFFFRVGL